jgi:signal transduction histidine kinase
MDTFADAGVRVKPEGSLPRRPALAIAPVRFATLPCVAGFYYLYAGAWLLLLQPGSLDSTAVLSTLRGPVTAASGLLVLWIASDALPRKVANLAYVVIAVVQLFFAVAFFDPRGLPTIGALAGFALALLAVPLVRRDLAEARLGPDAVGLALGAMLVPQGIYLLSTDGSARAIVASLQAPAVLAASLYVAAGVAIIVVQVLFWLPKMVRWAAHLFGGALVLWAWLFGASLNPLALALSTGVLLRGVATLLLPALSDWMAQFDCHSLRVRLALALTTVAIVPPLVILPFVLASVDGSRVQSTRQIAFLITLFVALASAVSGWLLAGYLSRTVVELVAVLGQIGKGAYHVRLSSGGTTEKLRLATAVDSLAETLGTRLAEREASLAAEHVARERAEAAVAARDEFLSVASHELRTPVTSVRGLSQVLAAQLERSGTLDPVRAQRALTIMDAQTARLATLIDRLLDLSRIESGRLILERGDADVGPIVGRVVDALRQVYPDRAFELNLSPAAIASVDAPRLEQVIMNLIDNALKFSPADTPIEVRVMLADSGLIEVIVRDYGVGIPDDQREKVFERFHQVNHGQSRQGLGLGLYISRQIVELHGGSVKVDSPPGGGTRFTISLPAAGREKVADGG